VTPAVLNVNEGHQAILECYVNGQSRIVWEKTGGSLPEGVSPYENQLVLTDVRPEDAGRYVCTAIDIPLANQGSAQVVISHGKEKYIRLIFFKLKKSVFAKYKFKHFLKLN
jgi:hypothetical protein